MNLPQIGTLPKMVPLGGTGTLVSNFLRQDERLEICCKVSLARGTPDRD